MRAVHATKAIETSRFLLKLQTLKHFASWFLKIVVIYQPGSVGQCSAESLLFLYSRMIGDEPLTAMK